MTRRLGPEAPKKKIGLSKKNNLVYVRKKIVNVVALCKPKIFTGDPKIKSNKKIHA